MTISVSNAASRMTTNAAAVATAMGGGTAAADVTAIAALLQVLVNRPDLLHPTMKLLPLSTSQGIINT